MIRNRIRSYGEELLAARPNPKLEDHPFVGCPRLLIQYPRRRWEDNIKMDLKEVGRGHMDWIELTQDRESWWSLVNAVMNLRVP